MIYTTSCRSPVSHLQASRLMAKSDRSPGKFHPVHYRHWTLSTELTHHTCSRSFDRVRHCDGPLHRPRSNRPCHPGPQHWHPRCKNNGCRNNVAHSSRLSPFVIGHHIIGPAALSAPVRPRPGRNRHRPRGHLVGARPCSHCRVMERSYTLKGDRAGCSAARHYVRNIGSEARRLHIPAGFAIGSSAAGRRVSSTTSLALRTIRALTETDCAAPRRFIRISRSAHQGSGLSPALPMVAHHLPGHCAYRLAVIQALFTGQREGLALAIGTAALSQDKPGMNE
ncbi:solute-binding protein [Pseudomonas sp. S37]|nr:solute-binding protein [Pseudomonas sp. S37]